MISEFFSGDLLNNLFLAFRVLWFIMPFLLPVVLVIGLFFAWISYKRNLFWSTQASILLEIKLPREILKSPVSMEIVMNVFSQAGGEQTWINRLVEGKTRDWFSLELVSLGGKIRFFIWARARFRAVIEAQLYSQFPGIEVYEVPDYTLPLSYDPEKISLWGCEWALTNKIDALPIKTYIDYKLDSLLAKEEQKVDPMTPMLEFMGGLTEGHNIWVQIIIRSHRKSRTADLFGEKDDYWKEEAKAEIKKLVEKTKAADGKPGNPLTEAEKETIQALERSVSKIPFDAGIRTLYIADKDKFNGSNIGGMLGMFKQFSSPNLNGFRPSAGLIGFDYPWQDMSGKRRERIRRSLLEGYKARQYFYPPYKGKKIFVLNAEELATIFHLPSQIVAPTPTLERVPSKKSEAPSNLPI